MGKFKLGYIIMVFGVIAVGAIGYAMYTVSTQQHHVRWAKFKKEHVCLSTDVLSISAEAYNNLSTAGFEGGIDNNFGILVVEEGILWQCTKQNQTDKLRDWLKSDQPFEAMPIEALPSIMETP